MTDRRSFFKKLGLAATAIAATGRVEATPSPPPPVPKVKSSRAHVALVVGYEPKVIKHYLGSGLVCAMAGGTDGVARLAVVEPIDRNSCTVTVPKPQSKHSPFSFFGWRKKQRPSPVYSLIVYVPE